LLPYARAVLRRLGHWAVVCALVFTIGAHWAVLQSVAWIGMTVSYSQTSSLREALIKTFDGLHPCKLCKAVQEGKRSEKKPDTQKPLNKIDLFCISGSWAVKAAAFSPVSTQVSGPISAPRTNPPKPPPRQIFG